MGARKYIVVTVLVWLLIGSWGLYLALEGSRLAAFEQQRQQQLIELGARLFGENCVVCHGPVGEGVVGPPLNRDALRGDPLQDREVFDFIRDTVAAGRPGTSGTRWELLHTGEWASYTAMPSFGVEYGGPFNEQQLRAIASFIMAGDWNEVWFYIPDPVIPEDREELLAQMPDAQGLPEDLNRQGKEIFVDRGCITCHTVGSVGGFTGPDLSQVGAWVALDREYWGDFLWDWIANPPQVQNRGPVYWSNYAGPLPFAQRVVEVREADVERSGPVRQRGRGAGLTPPVSEQGGGAQFLDIPSPVPHTLPTQMPPMPMTDEERDILVEYLLGLRG